MSKLIGTNPNQVPSNADLGTAAFMDATDFLTSRGSSLSAVNAVIPKTAVDVFVYDTSRDSDGGAWRKRTQHLSWYNERLNTTDRGSRREFPAVAVIVAESNQVTIYDGDDPSMPMWMVFETNASDMIASGILSLTMLNGVLAVGRNTPLHVINFVSDGHTSYTPTSRNSYLGAIGQRNSGLGVSANLGTPYVVANVGNDVAMTVLPNAPIDAATGLPVPTIAVATNGGVSVIKDDGSVVDITWSSDGTVGDVTFDTDNNIVVGIGAATGVFNYGYRVYALPSSDLSEGAGYSNSSNDLFDAGPTQFSVPSYTPTVKYLGNTANTIKITPNHIGSSTSGLTCIDRNDPSVSYITSTYNTGWMNGDIKLATLSDTDDTDVTGVELVDNGVFNNGGDWSFGGGWNFANGQAEIDTTNNDLLSQDIGMVTGKTYTVSLIMTEYTDGVLDVRLGGNATQTATGTGVHTFTGVAGGSTLQIYAFTNATLSIDDISVRLAEKDRSVNGNGLQVFGTVTKNPVATGADLMAYSGFTASNYLEQPYFSGLNAGTGGYSITFWAKNDSTAGHVACRGTADADESMRIYFDTSNYGIYFDYGVGAPYCYLTNGTDRAFANNGSWHQVVVHVSAGGPGHIYLDGKRMPVTVVGNAVSTIPNDTDYKLRVGAGYGSLGSAAAPFAGSIALFRYSLSIPSAEQIKKIYNDEKVLFQDNAQATLYGSSDAVTALAYDDTADLLHVGTSAGRSVFRGLRRIDNTTDAVGVAISASNGMVAED
jgi:hypothetical protein